MKKILPAIATVISISISSWYFTSKPVQATQQMIQVEKGLFDELIRDNTEIKERLDGLTRASFKLLKRAEAVEKKLEIEVPEEFKIPVKE